MDALANLFVEVLRITGEVGMVKPGNLAIDGSKYRVNASPHKAMSYGYMKKEVSRLRQEIGALLRQAEKVGAEEDAAMGSRRGDELPEGLKRREERLAVIEEAMHRLEAEVQAEAEAQRRQREQADRAVAA